MTRFLAYPAAATGHVLPLIPGLLELQRRGHDVLVKVPPDLLPQVASLGLAAEPVAAEVLDVPVTDYQATTDAQRLASGQTDLMARGVHEIPDLEAAIAAWRPDVLLVDVIAYGALTAAARSGLPTAMVTPSVLALPGRGIPPYGLGLRPRRGPVGAVRDAVLWRLVERLFGKAMLPGLNRLRASAGLPAYRSPLDVFDEVDAVIALTGAPLEYPRSDLPAHVHLAGTQVFDLPAAPPGYLAEPGDPWVLVTCSTDYQGDEQLARVAVEALRDEPVRVLLTLADAYDGAGVESGGNVRVERFVPHGQVLPHCSVVVSHGGMGIAAKAMAHGVPSVIVPYGRDQPEIARRVAVAGAGVVVKPRRLSARRLRAAVGEARGMTAGAAAAGRMLRGAGGAGRFADVAVCLASAGGVDDDHRQAVDRDLR